MNKILSGALIGVVAFVVIAPVLAWIMPKADTTSGADGSSAEGDGSDNPFVPLPRGDAPAVDAPAAPRTPRDSDRVSANDHEEGRGIIAFSVKGDGDDEKDEDDDRHEGRKNKHKHWRDD